MTTKRTARLWLGVGAAALIGTGVGPSAAGAPDGADSVKMAQAAPHVGHDTASQAKTGAGGEGGEGGEGAGSFDPRIKFAQNMGLVRGHLLVGDELIKEGRWDDALPHFLHPIEELYASIGPTIKRQGIRQFESQLKALSQAVQSKKTDAYAAALKVVDVRLNDVDNGMRKFARPYAAMTLKTAIAIMQSAGTEYGEAIEAGRIAKPVEYQDSRGFVFHASRLIDSLAPELKKKDAAALANIQATVTKLKAVWPTVVPPEAPVKDKAAVLSLIAEIELAASPFLN